MFTRHETISRTKHKLNTLPEESSYQKTDKEEHDENITTIRTSSKLFKRFSAPKLRDNSRSKDDNTNRIRRYNSGSQINQNGHHKKKSLDRTHESFDIRMTYDYYQRNLRKDDVFYRFSSNVDRYGFVESEENKPTVMSTQMTKQERKLEKKDAERSLKWAHWVAQSKYVIHSGSFGSSLFVFPSGSKFVDRVCKGIPDAWRNPVWYSLVTKSGGETDERLIAIYMSLLNLSSTHERQIDLDIPRTLHKHIMFRTRYGPGQRALFNVLRAFSNYDKKVGYCQGMTNLVTILLMYYSEEYAFIMLIRLFERCNLHNLYIPGFPALMESFYIQERLMGMYTPKISKHLDKLQIQSTAYATKWYITLFASDTVPHHTVLRIWDLLMLHGFDVLYFVAVALLKYNKSNLLASDFDNALTILSSFMDVVDDDKFIKRIVKMFDKKGRKVLINALKDEYKSQSNH